jgi:LEA14-like dessication related protein
MDAFRAVLLGSRLRIAGTAIVALLLAVGLAVGLGVFGAPSVAAVDNEFGDVNESTTTIETDLVINNPNPFGVNLGGVDVDYTVSMNDVRVAEGAREGVSIQSGNSTIPLTTRMDHEQIPPWWASHVRNGEQSQLVIDADAESERLGRGKQFTAERSIETDVVGQFDSNETRPVEVDDSAVSLLPVVEEPFMYINETRAEWGDVSREETPMNVAFAAHNPQSFPITVAEMEYEITMNDVVVGEGSSDTNAVIAPGETRDIETQTAITNDALDEWWVSHLRNDQVTDVQIRFYATLEVDGQEIRVPVRPLDHDETVETHIFEGDKR